MDPKLLTRAQDALKVLGLREAAHRVEVVHYHFVGAEDPPMLVVFVDDRRIGPETRRRLKRLAGPLKEGFAGSLWGNVNVEGFRARIDILDALECHIEAVEEPPTEDAVQEAERLASLTPDEAVEEVQRRAEALQQPRTVTRTVCGPREGER